MTDHQRILEFEGILKSLPLPICIFQPDGTITQTTPVFDTIFSSTAAPLTEKNLFETLPESHKNNLIEMIQSCPPNCGTQIRQLPGINSPDLPQNWSIQSVSTAENKILSYILKIEDLPNRLSPITNEHTIQIQTILDAIPISAVIREPNGRLLITNQNFANFFNLTPQSLSGQFFQDILPEPSRNANFINTILEMSQQILHNNESQIIPEIPLILADGQTRWIQVESLPLKLDNNFFGILEFASDVTQIRENKNRLESLHDIIEKSQSVIFTWRNQESWPVDFVSSNVFQLCGYTDSEFLSGSIRYADLIHPDDLPRVIDEVLEHSANPDITEFSHTPYRVIDKNGTEKIVKDWTLIIRDTNNQVTHYKGIIEDATETIRMQTQLQESTSTLQTIFNTVLTGIVMIDETTKTIVSVNEIACEMIGLPKEKIIGTICHGFMCPAEIGKCPITDLHQNIDHSERVLIRADGSQIPIMKSVKRITIGNTPHLLDCFIDISSLKNAQKEIKNNLDELNKAKQLMNRVFDLLPMRIYWRNRDLHYLGGNKNFTQDVGLNNPEELEGKSYADLPLPPCPHLCQNEDRATLESQTLILNKEGTCINADGKTSWLTYSKVPLTDNDNNVIGVISVDYDITRRKQQENTLKALYDDLEKSHHDLKTMQNQILQSEKLASLGQLAAGIAHEINNPLGFISSNIDTLSLYVQSYTELFSAYESLKNILIQEQWDKARQQIQHLENLAANLNLNFIQNDIETLISQTQDGVDRIRKIVESLKIFARNDDTADVSHDIESLIDSAAHIVWNELKYKADVHKDYHHPPAVLCNAQRIGQVIINLLVNAAQAIPEKGTITIRTFTENDMTCVQISDTGCGIPEAVIKKIFDPFFTTKEIGKGTGLGLSIAYDIIKQHHGSLEVISQVNQGTSFTFKLPLNTTPAEIKPKEMEPSEMPDAAQN